MERLSGGDGMGRGTWRFESWAGLLVRWHWRIRVGCVEWVETQPRNVSRGDGCS